MIEQVTSDIKNVSSLFEQTKKVKEEQEIVNEIKIDTLPADDFSNDLIGRLQNDIKVHLKDDEYDHEKTKVVN